LIGSIVFEGNVSLIQPFLPIFPPLIMRLPSLSTTHSLGFVTSALPFSIRIFDSASAARRRLAAVTSSAPDPAAA